MKSGINLLFFCIRLMLCSSIKIELQMTSTEISHARVGKEHLPLKSPTNVTLHMNNDIYYYAEIVIGPKDKYGCQNQKFTVLVDTACSVLWVPSARGDKTVTAGKLNTYDHNKSPTYEPVKGFEKEDVRITYGKGIIIGYLASDQVTLENINITRQVFLEITDGKFYEDSRVFDGVLGLSLPYEDPNLYNCSVIPTMRKDQLIEKQIVAFYFNSKATKKVGGEVTFGYLDNTKFKGDVSYLTALSGASYWMLLIQGINVNETNILSSENHAIMDTGTSLILGPWEDVRNIYTQIFPSSIVRESDDSFKCEDAKKLNSITFLIQGKKFELKGEDFTLKIKKNGKYRCYIGIGGTEGGDPKQWILGITFLRNKYSVFDYEKRQIGFAELA